MTHRVVALLRVSSKGQAEKDTPEDQRRAFDRMLETRGGRMVEIIDYGASGLSGRKDFADRPDLQRLKALSEKKAYDELWVRYLNRLTRHPDVMERLAVYAMVRDAGAIIVDSSGHAIDPKTELGEFDFYLRSWMASKDADEILEKTLAGKRRKAGEGRLVSGTPPWGRSFDKATGAWGLTPAAKSYRRLFDLVLQGKTLWMIARQLESEGIASERGRPWTASMVGNLVKARHAAGLYTTHGHTFRIPPIVDEVTQAQAVSRLRANDNAGGPHATIPALLRKVLVCGVCGSPMHTNRNSARPGKPPLPAFYFCSSRGPCKRNHRIEDVDEAVKRTLREWLQQPRTLEIGAGGAPEGDDPEIAAQEAAKALRKCDRDEDQILRLLQSGLATEKVARERLLAVKERRAAAEQRKAEAQARAESRERREEIGLSLQARVNELRKRLGKAGFAEWRDLVEILFDRAAGYHVAIWPDGKVKLRGALKVGDDLGNRASPSRTRCSIPVTLEAVA